MLTLELSSYLLEIPDCAYTTLSQFWLAVWNSVKSTIKSTIQADLLILEINEKATWFIIMSHYGSKIERFLRKTLSP